MRAILVAACVAIAPLGIAQAQPAEMKIPVSSADLQSDASLAALVARIEAGAKTLCSQSREAPLALNDQISCTNAATREAIGKTKLEKLINYYETGTAEPKLEVMSATLASN